MLSEKQTWSGFENTIRVISFYPNAFKVDDPTLKEVLARLKDSSQFELRKRHVEDFNKRNLWRKRGIALVPLQYPHNQFGTR